MSRSSTKKTIRHILAIDGGGIRGIIPALVLAHLEKLTGKATSSLFDLIVGTSTGAIIALGIAKPAEQAPARAHYTADDLADLYEKHADDIFYRSTWKSLYSAGGLADEKYQHDKLEDLLIDYFGNYRLETLLTKVMTPAYDIEYRVPCFIKSWKARHSRLQLRHVSRAATAAPTFFEPHQIKINQKVRTLIDGGIFINNPAMSAYIEARKIFPDDEIYVVSLGTGNLRNPIAYSDARNWGKVEWSSPIVGCMSDGLSDTVNHQLLHLLGNNYIRLQANLKEASDKIDQINSSNIKLLKQAASNLIKARAPRLEKLASQLSDSAS
ncbi:MAG: patatin-like phospholipase family protein [Phycisphaerae bacterium]|nr:patatin-like phospholipase family protein [Phycisphaerae bacterium]